MLQSQHVRARSAGRIGETDIVHRNRGRQRKPELEIAVDSELAPGRRLYRVGDLAFVLVEIDGHQDGDAGGDQRHEEHDDSYDDGSKAHPEPPYYSRWSAGQMIDPARVARKYPVNG